MSYVKSVKKALIGKRITKAEANAFRDGRGGYAHQWRLTLDDGSEVWFTTQEVEGPEGYGVEIGVRSPRLGTYTSTAGTKPLGVK